eukprot:6804630-Alexandrium_andersonii.AAC.1
MAPRPHGCSSMRQVRAEAEACFGPRVCGCFTPRPFPEESEGRGAEAPGGGPLASELGAEGS